MAETEELSVVGVEVWPQAMQQYQTNHCYMYTAGTDRGLGLSNVGRRLLYSLVGRELAFFDKEILRTIA
jgi:hypothetical protein